MTTSEQLLLDATLSIAKLQAWLEAQNQREIYYLNGDVAYTNEAEVLATIAIGDRSIYQKVNIAGVDYWFTGDPLTLTPYMEDIGITDGTITLAKLVNIAGLSVIGNSTGSSGVPQVISIATLRTLLSITDPPSISGKVDRAEGYSLVANTAIANFHAPMSDNQDLSGLVVQVTGSSLITDTEKIRLSGIIAPQTITLPAGADLTTRLADAVETTDYPTGWVLTAVGDNTMNLQIVHTLTGREVSSITVKVTDEIGKRWLTPKRDAYSGILENGETLIIEGLAPNYDFPLTLILMFK